MRDLDPRYAAGLFDGEGNISVSRAMRPVVSISNTFEPVLEALKAKYNGTIHTKTSNEHTQNICFEWQVQVIEDSLKFLQDIQPYVWIKKEEVEAAIVLSKVPRKRNR